MANEMSPDSDGALTSSLTEKAVRCEPLTQELNAIPYQKRLALVREMERILTERDDAKISLEVKTGRDTQGDEHLVDLQCVAESGRFDIYNLPGTIEQQPILQELKLNLDRSHSRFLSTGGKEILPRRPQSK